MRLSKRDSTATKNKLIIRDDSKNIKQQIVEAMELWKQEYKNEITALNEEIIDIKANQVFISKKYDKLNIEHQKFFQIIAQPKKKFLL